MQLQLISVATRDPQPIVYSLLEKKIINSARAETLTARVVVTAVEGHGPEC